MKKQVVIYGIVNTRSSNLDIELPAFHLRKINAEDYLKLFFPGSKHWKIKRFLLKQLD